MLEHQADIPTQKLLWRWTYKRMDTSTNDEFMVTPEDVENWGRKVNFSDKEIADNFMLMTIYLRDFKYYQSIGQPVPYKAYMTHERKMFFKKDDGSLEEFY